MNTNFTAIYKQVDGWWVGWVEEVPGTNAQEKTREELFQSLRVVLEEALEFNREDARKAAEEHYQESPLLT